MLIVDILATVYAVPGGYRIVPDLPWLLQLMLLFVPSRGSVISYVIIGVGLYYYTSEVDQDKVRKFEKRLHIYMLYAAVTYIWMIYWFLAHSQIVEELPAHLANQVL